MNDRCPKCGKILMMTTQVIKEYFSDNKEYDPSKKHWICPQCERGKDEEKD